NASPALRPSSQGHLNSRSHLSQSFKTESCLSTYLNGGETLSRRSSESVASPTVEGADNTTVDIESLSESNKDERNGYVVDRAPLPLQRNRSNSLLTFKKQAASTAKTISNGTRHTLLKPTHSAGSKSTVVIRSQSSKPFKTITSIKDSSKHYNNPDVYHEAASFHAHITSKVIATVIVAKGHTNAIRAQPHSVESMICSAMSGHFTQEIDRMSAHNAIKHS
ncbi:hypothetical protein HDU80_000268, partial [Chytriomyces hyalinus]